MHVKKLFKKKRIAMAVLGVVLLFSGLFLPYDKVVNEYTVFKLKKMVREANAVSTCPSNAGGTVTLKMQCSVQNQAGTCNCCTDVVGNYICGGYDYVPFMPAGGNNTGARMCVLKGLAGVDGSQIQAGDFLIACDIPPVDVLDLGMFASSPVAKADPEAGFIKNSVLFAFIDYIFNRA